MTLSSFTCVMSSGGCVRHRGRMCVGGEDAVLVVCISCACVQNDCACDEKVREGVFKGESEGERERVEERKSATERAAESERGYRQHARLRTGKWACCIMLQCVALTGKWATIWSCAKKCVKYS